MEQIAMEEDQVYLHTSELFCEKNGSLWLPDYLQMTVWEHCMHWTVGYM